MIKEMLIGSECFLEVLKSPKDFREILDKLKALEGKVSLELDDNLGNIYEVLHKNKNREELKLLSRDLDKHNINLEENYTNKLNYVINKDEVTNIKQWFSKKEVFDINNPYIIFRTETENVRQVNKIDHFKEVYLISLSEVKCIEIFIEKIQKVFSENMIFDEDILESMKQLEAGFDLRIKEIIYHLYCIENEVPKLIAAGIKGFREVGENLTISCSPERSRTTVENLLTKRNGNESINCELHTKMVKVGSRAPDRIYFCPEVINTKNIDTLGKIFIYKITKHV